MYLGKTALLHQYLRCSQWHVATAQHAAETLNSTQEPRSRVSCQSPGSVVANMKAGFCFRSVRKLMTSAACL